MPEFDIAVVGSGQGGVPLAVALAERGRRVVLFERGEPGGTCVNTGCTPSKAFLASAHAAGRARRAAALGVHADVRVDLPFVLERVRRLVREWREGVTEKFGADGPVLVRAEAAFGSDAHELVAGGERYRAPIVILDTGGAPSVPPVDGLAGTPFLTSSTWWAQRDLPEHLLVLGAGYIGLELGQGTLRLGRAVTMISPDERVLPHEDPEVCAVLTRALRDEGMDLRLGTRATRVAYENGTFRLALDDGSVVRGDGLLVAAGRSPVVPDGAERVGIRRDARGAIRVDARLRTEIEGVYALGDAAGQPAFTHVAWEDHRRILDALDGGARTRDDRVLAYATYTEPQVGRVGLTTEAARADGYDVREVRYPMSRVARAIEWGVEDGVLILTVERVSRRLLGATFVGYECAELVQLVLAVMEAGGDAETLARTVFIHPTLAEGVASAAREAV